MKQKQQQTTKNTVTTKKINKNFFFLRVFHILISLLQ